MWELETHVSEIIQRTPTIKTFRFYIEDKKVSYRPGQFFYVTIKVGEEEAVHHFTLSSSPSEKGFIDFTKRITTSDYSQALDKMRPGDWARLRGAEGEFTLPRKQRKLAFLSGGIGITPLRSMIRYIHDRRLDFDIVLLYANNNWADIAFREELEHISIARPNIKVEYILSGPDFPPGWQGEKGYITKDVVARLAPDFMERAFYISGPMKMVFALEQQLTDLGIPPEKVKRDYFPGYD